MGLKASRVWCEPVRPAGTASLFIKRNVIRALSGAGARNVPGNLGGNADLSPYGERSFFNIDKGNE